MYTSDKEVIILEHIYYDDSLKQRDLADKAGISLGMTNIILKQLIEKGWLVTKRLNNRNINYMVSPAGIEEIFKRKYQYFKRTMDDVRLYKERIDCFISRAIMEGYKSIVLIGKSDLEFIIEFACKEARIEYKKVENENDLPMHSLAIYSEQHEINNKSKQWLRTIVLEKGNIL